MGWLPLFWNVTDRKCLIIGGGAVALRKAELLLSFDAQVLVVAPTLCSGFSDLPVQTRLHPFADSDIAGASLVIDATGNPDVTRRAKALCSQQNIPFNAVDQKEDCSVIFAALLRRGKLTAAFSTEGASPLAAIWARDRFGEILPDCFADILEQMERLRPLAKATIPSSEVRRRFLKACFLEAMEREAVLEEAEIRQLLEEYV